MAVKPAEMRAAMGDDLVRVVRGTRANYNAYQRRVRRGEIKELDPEGDAEVRELVPCPDLPCGGKKKPQFRKEQAHSYSQTTDNDLTHYYGMYV